MAQINFPIKKGTKSAYTAIEEKDAGTIYILTDADGENNMFLGEIPVGKGSHEKTVQNASFNNGNGILTFLYTDGSTDETSLLGLYEFGETNTTVMSIDGRTVTSEVKLSESPGNAIGVEEGRGLYVDVADKADRVTSPTAGNIVTLDADGNIADSGFPIESISVSPPNPLQANVIDISEMMNIPTSADITALLFKSSSGGKDTVRLTGFDSSGSTDDLVITPQPGFGSHFYQSLVNRELNASLQPTDYIIEISVDDGETPSGIKIPYGVKNFDITYFLTKSGGFQYSYYVTTDNVMKPFDIFNTPFANFLGTGTSLTINGATVAKTNIKSIYFGTSYSGVTQTGGNFLYGFTALISADFAGLTNVASIGNNFAYGCTGLTEIDLSAFSNVETIGNGFLYGCTGLTEIDLSAFTNVETIGNGFLQGCTNILALDFSAFENLTVIGSNFAYGCTKMEEIDISGFTAVTTINTAFLYNCIALQEFDFSPLSSLTALTNAFMQKCASLTEIDLSPLTSVTAIGNDVLRELTKVEKINMSGLGVLTIGPAVFYGNTKLREFDLSGLDNLTNVQDYFFGACTSLNKIQIGGVNWSSKTVTKTNSLASVPNVNTARLYADAADLAVNFKNKVNNMSNWSIVLNGNG